MPDQFEVKSWKISQRYVIAINLHAKLTVVKFGDTKQKTSIPQLEIIILYLEQRCHSAHHLATVSGLALLTKIKFEY